ncbi:MAG: Gfo/Idh/MocA family protein [bacterium]
MEIFNIGIIGFGRMGITHYSIINSHKQVKIKAVADTSGLILSLLKKYIPATNVYSDYEDLLDSEQIDAVLVCTPPNLHYKIIKACADKGIHVFVEKPFTTEYEKAKELSLLFSEKKLINQVGYVNRYNDVFQKTKELIDDNIIGKIIRFRSEMFSRTIIQPEESTSWRSARESGGGVVFDMAAHSIDIVNYLIGKPDKITGSSLNVIYSKDIEDAVSSTFLYKNGMNGTIYVNWSDESFRKPTNKIEIFGSEGKILADQHSLKIYLKKTNKNQRLREGWNTLYITDIFNPVPFYVRGNEFTRQLYNFIDCIEGKENNNLCSFREASNTLDVIENIFTDYNNNGRL